MISDEQAKQIKEQLLKQIENLPAEQQDTIKTQLKDMNNEQLEEFLIKNKMIQQQGEEDKQQSPFRLIVEGKIPSSKIAEIDKAIAILEINPISKGHTIVIPKVAVKEDALSPEIYSFAQEVADKIKEKLKPKKVNTIPAEILGEAIINVLPVYNDETMESPRKQADKNELKKIQEELTKEQTKEKTKEPKKSEKPKEVKKKEPLPKVPKRIP